MADNLTEKVAPVASKLSLDGVLPVLDAAVKESDSFEGLLQAALVGVVSVLVAGVVKNVFKH